MIRGFYHSNKSNVLFPKLKNPHREKLREMALGEVIGVERGHLLGVQLREGAKLRVGQRYLLQTPEGREISFTLRDLYYPDFSPAVQIEGGPALFGYRGGGVGPRTVLTERTTGPGIGDDGPGP